MNIKYFLTFFLFQYITILVYTQTISFTEYRESQLQSENFRNTLEFVSEPSTVSGSKYLDYHSGIKKSYLFDGDFQLPITAGGENFISGNKLKFFHVVQFVPQAKIRIFDNDEKWNDKSKPVRTPTFYPKIYYFITNQRFWNVEKKYKFYLGIGVLHHSNGQDGTEFVDFSDTVNIYNGSFSESLITQYLVGGSIKLFQKKIENLAKLDRKLKRNKINSLVSIKSERNFEFLWKIGYEDHPLFFTNQKFHKTGVYGGNRAFMNLVLKKSFKYDSYFYEKSKWRNKNLNSEKETYRFTLNLEYITDLSYNSGGFNNLQKIDILNVEKRLNLVLSFYKRIFDSRYPAVFAQVAYYGSDNYNIYFQKSMYQAKIGLAFSFFEYSKLHKD